jgi:hypothetical protein
MLFCFCIVLGTVYTQQQTYKYTASHVAFMRVLNKDLADNAQTVDDIWIWLNSVVSNIGSRTIDHIEGNCAYDAVNMQDVTIDGVVYSLVSPELQTSACSTENLDFIQGGDDEVYLTGNHMILSFGVFTDRSSPYYPVAKSSNKDFKVRSSEVKTLDPLRDDKIVEICSSQWTEKCLYRDGFDNTPGSTFGWPGVKVGNRYVYENSSFAMIFTNGADPQFIYPCYSYAGRNQFVPEDSESEDTGPVTVTSAPAAAPGPGPAPTPSPTPAAAPGPGPAPTPSPTPAAAPGPGPAPTPSPTPAAAPGPGPAPLSGRRLQIDVSPGKGAPDGLTADDVVVSNCSLAWVSSGYDIRAGCLLDSSRQPTAFEAYITAVQGYEDVRKLQDYYFGCEKLTTLDKERVADTYVQASATLDSYLEGEDSYGIFFSTENQESWIQESKTAISLLRRHKYIDENTRVFRTYCITRNLGKDELFYSMLVFEFKISTVGRIEVDVEAQYVPIIQYYYGNDGYEWRSQEVLVLEVAMLCIFGLFVLREIHQLLTVRVAACLAHANNFSKANPLTQKRGAIIKPEQVDEEIGEFAVVTKENGRSEVAAANAGDVGSVGGSAHSSPRIADISHNIDQAIGEIDDKLSELGDALEDFMPNIAGWNDILDWSTILVLVLGMAYRIEYVHAAEAFHNMVLDLEKQRSYDDRLEKIVGDFRNIGDLTNTLKLIAISIVGVGLMQFFRYFSFDKRLGIVTATMGAALKDLLPVLLIFATVVAAYAVLGTEIYGTQLEEVSQQLRCESIFRVFFVHLTVVCLFVCLLVFVASGRISGDH